MGIPYETPAEFTKWVKYTHDRPFNDHRYAVDGTKLRQLGWEQKTSFKDGLKATVEWYRLFGERWWGDISKVLSPFPVVEGRVVMSDHEPISDHPQPHSGGSVDDGLGKKKAAVNGVNGGPVGGVVAA